MNEELKNIAKKVNQLFTRYGIKSVTMDDISRELGISKKTLYQHVKDKTELVELIVDSEFEEKESCLSKLITTYENAIDEIYQVHKVVIQIFKEYSPTSEYDLRKYYPVVHQRMHQLRRQKLMENYSNNLKKGIEEGLYREEINVELIAKLQVQRVENTFENDFLTIEEMIKPASFIEIFNYHVRGIATEKGLIELEKVIQKMKSDYIKLNINL